LQGFKRNVKVGRSIIDYCLKCVREEVLLEVKSAVMKVGEYAMYPDYPSPRGRRHLEDIIKWRKAERGNSVYYNFARSDVLHA